jgi:hypothetical protein
MRREAASCHLPEVWPPAAERRIAVWLWLQMRVDVFVSRGWFGVRIGQWYASVRSPGHRPLFSERNRIKCAVVPLGRGWRFVVKWA